MVNYYKAQASSQIDDIFLALSDSTRRDILERLSLQNLTVSEIAKPYDMSLPAVSKHLSVLERARFVSRHKIGREYRVSFDPRTMRTAADYIAFYQKYWNKQIDQLEKFLARKFNEDEK
jgi:DNA-binding transcriptional ArsR family regulator